MGFIQVVRNARSIADIQKDAGGAAAAFSKTTLQRYLRQHNPTEDQYSRAVYNFTYSCAGYTVASYVLGLGDRHNDNIMLTKSGHLFRKFPFFFLQFHIFCFSFLSSFQI
jgi:phosphatidylinositol kinase/protein kinase (PI-3  family)